MKRLELKTEGGIYILYSDEKNVLRHFAIDCNCQEFHGCHYRKEESSLESIIKLRGYKKSPSTKTENTFYMNEAIFLTQLRKNPITIVCNNCGTEFPFTNESYLKLLKEMRNSN